MVVRSMFVISFKMEICTNAATTEPCSIDPMDCSPPGSSASGIFQERILEQVAISSFNVQKSTSKCLRHILNGLNESNINTCYQVYYQHMISNLMLNFILRTREMILYLLQEYIIINEYNNSILCYLLQKSCITHQRNEKYSKKVYTTTDMYL